MQILSYGCANGCFYGCFYRLAKARLGPVLTRLHLTPTKRLTQCSPTCSVIARLFIGNGGLPYHVINRGNARATVFHKDADYLAFEHLIDLACQRLPLRVARLLPHAQPLPPRPPAPRRRRPQPMEAVAHDLPRPPLSPPRPQQRPRLAGPVQSLPHPDGRPPAHRPALCRAEPPEPLRANLVTHTEAWRWSSLHWFGAAGASGAASPPAWLSDWPVTRPPHWREWVNQPQTEEEVRALRHSVQRGTPYGRMGQRRGFSKPPTGWDWHPPSDPAVDRLRPRKSRMSPFPSRR